MLTGVRNVVCLPYPPPLNPASQVSMAVLCALARLPCVNTQDTSDTQHLPASLGSSSCAAPSVLLSLGGIVPMPNTNALAVLATLTCISDMRCARPVEECRLIIDAALTALLWPMGQGLYAPSQCPQQL